MRKLMPDWGNVAMHYKDGQKAKLGDLVRGKPYNTPYEIVGTVIGLVPSANSRNLHVAFVEAKRPKLIKSSDGRLGLAAEDVHAMLEHGAKFWAALGGDRNEPTYILEALVNYGTASDFTLITRSV